jgi:hypothetical protein
MRGQGVHAPALRHRTRQVELLRSDGLLELDDSVPDALRTQIADYFSGRCEDGDPSRHRELHVVTEAKPWMHKDEISILASLLHQDDCVLEFGSGNSTLWLAKRVREVHAVEHDQEWAARMTASAPHNVTLHWRRPAFPHHSGTPAQSGQFVDYLQVPSLLGRTFDACLVDGRARIESAMSAANWLKTGAWLFFHDWFRRPRYTSRLAELSGVYELCTDLSLPNARQTLAVFRKR